MISDGSASTATVVTGSPGKSDRSTNCWADDPEYHTIRVNGVDVVYECGLATVSESGLCERHELQLLGRVSKTKDEPTLENLFKKGRKGG
jgi:hypothetical protein